MKSVLLILSLSLNTLLLAQQGSIPEIPYRSVAKFLKLPPDLYLGRFPAWPSTPRDTFSFSHAAVRPAPPTAPAPHNSWNSMEALLREVGL